MGGGMGGRMGDGGMGGRSHGQILDNINNARNGVSGSNWANWIANGAARTVAQNKLQMYQNSGCPVGSHMTQIVTASNICTTSAPTTCVNYQNVDNICVPNTNNKNSFAVERKDPFAQPMGVQGNFYCPNGSNLMMTCVSVPNGAAEYAAAPGSCGMNGLTRSGYHKSAVYTCKPAPPVCATNEYRALLKFEKSCYTAPNGNTTCKTPGASSYRCYPKGDGTSCPNYTAIYNVASNIHYQNGQGAAGSEKFAGCEGFVA